MIEAYTNQTATLERHSGQDRNGKSTYDAGVAVAGRWSYKRRLIRNAAGEQVISSGSFYTQAAISVGDRLTDPDGRAWPVLAVSPQYDLGGTLVFRDVSF